MKQLFAAIFVLSIQSMLPSMAAELSTPEAALKALEGAYLRNDIDAAVQARDFEFEATQIIISLIKTLPPDPELVKQAAEVLELAYRAEIKKTGFPEISKFKCAVVEKSEVRTGLVEMIEECLQPDGRISREKVHAAKSKLGWRIVVLATRGLTPRSKRGPTASHQPRAGGTRCIITGPGLASCRRSRLNSNVRRHRNL